LHPAVEVRCDAPQKTKKGTLRLEMSKCSLYGNLGVGIFVKGFSNSVEYDIDDATRASNRNGEEIVVIEEEESMTSESCNVVWEFFVDDPILQEQGWKLYSEEDCRLIESFWNSNSGKRHGKKITASSGHLIDIDAMEQTNETTFYSRPIRRRTNFQNYNNLNF